MELNKETLKKLRGLILFTACIVVALVNYKALFSVIRIGFNIIFPFVLGGGVAFVINAPMQFIERNLFENKWMKDKKLAQKLSRPMSLLIALLFVIALISLVIFVVVPELGTTFVSLGTTVSDFIPQLQKWIDEFFKGNELLVTWANNLDFDWNKIVSSAVNFLKNGAGNVLTSTYGIVKSVINGLTTFFIGFVFACYIVLQKEKLSVQIKKVLYALLPKDAVENVLKVSALSYRTFLNFLTGQCVEAVILGSMFFVAMSLLRFPYALLVGVLIAFTALIPIFGAFIGCGIGAFLILMVSPIQAAAFIVLFLVLQQVEGNFIYPHVVGGSIGLPSIWVLVAVSLGSSLMGIVGMLLFIPLTSVFYTLFREYIYDRLDKKKIAISPEGETAHMPSQEEETAKREDK